MFLNQQSIYFNLDLPEFVNRFKVAFLLKVVPVIDSAISWLSQEVQIKQPQSADPPTIELGGIGLPVANLLAAFLILHLIIYTLRLCMSPSYSVASPSASGDSEGIVNEIKDFQKEIERFKSNSSVTQGNQSINQFVSFYYSLTLVSRKIADLALTSSLTNSKLLKDIKEKINASQRNKTKNDLSMDASREQSTEISQRNLNALKESVVTLIGPKGTQFSHPITHNSYSSAGSSINPIEIEAEPKTFKNKIPGFGVPQQRPVVDRRSNTPLPPHPPQRISRPNNHSPIGLIPLSPKSTNQTNFEPKSIDKVIMNEQSAMEMETSAVPQEQVPTELPQVIIQKPRIPPPPAKKTVAPPPPLARKNFTPIIPPSV